LNELMLMQIARDTLEVSMVVGGPLLMAALVMGLFVSVFQAVTQVSEFTLTFVPKVLAVSGVLALMMPFMLDRLIRFTEGIFRLIPTMVN